MGVASGRGQSCSYCLSVSLVRQDPVGASLLGPLAGPALLSQQLGLPQAVMAAQAPGVITGERAPLVLPTLPSSCATNRRLLFQA